jgi:hypothetical protein
MSEQDSRHTIMAFLCPTCGQSMPWVGEDAPFDAATKKASTVYLCRRHGYWKVTPNNEVIKLPESYGTV